MKYLQKRYGTEGIEAGCDEAGRGCLAGPVFAAAVILKDHHHYGPLNDSKKMPEAAREKLRVTIEREALAWAVGIVDPREIDQINILNASFLAMHRALDKLPITPDLLLIDGNRFNRYKTIQHQCIIKGDGLYQSIAAASILAKTHRDAYMRKIHEDHPCYHWNNNKGYPTPSHREALHKHGPCTHHRQSFMLIPAQTRLAF